MMFNAYVIYNRVVKAHERPIFTQDSSDEFIERVHRDYLASKPEAQQKIEECLIYEVGSYDDNTGLIVVIEKNLICDCKNFKVPQNSDKSVIGPEEVLENA